MPLNKKGKKIKKAMTKQYGKKKGEKVFYAMESSGKLKKVIKAVSGRDAGMGMGGKTGNYGGGSKSSGSGNGRDPSAQYKDSKPLSQESRKALTEQRKQARARISPSTTPVGRAIAQGIGVLTGVPYFGSKLGSRIVDYSPMAFGVPKSKRPKQTALPIKGPIQTTPLLPEGDGPVQTALPIEGPIQTKPILPLEKKRLGTVSSTGQFGYSVGLKKGGMLRQGKPKLAKKGWK